MEPRLEILSCATCGAPVALADAPAVTCTSCGASVEVPATHREAFAAMRRDSAGRAEAQALYAKLGAPPRGLRLIGVVFDPSSAIKPLDRSRAILLRAFVWYYRWAALVFGPFLVLLAAILLQFLAERMIAAHYRVELETLTIATRDWIGLPFPVLATVLGTIAGVYGRRKAIGLARLQAALAARPPQHAGGPSSCRRCGGPLAVDGDALGVRCVYCGADNLVALPPAWVEQIRGDAQSISDEITHAHGELVAQRRRLRRSALLRVGPVALFLGAILVIVVATGGEKESIARDEPSWPLMAKDPRPLGLRLVRAAHGTVVPSGGLQQVDFAAGCPVPVMVSPSLCDGTACTLRLYAALRHGETATLTLSHVPPGTHVRVERHHGFPWPRSFTDAFGEREADVPVTAEGAVRFTATWSAWHELAVVLPGAPPAQPVGVCFAVAGASH